jgi:hypothetical protein
MSDTIIIEPQFSNPECRPNSEDSNRLNYSLGGRGKKINHADMLEWIRTPKRQTVKYSDGFLSFGGSIGYLCQCGFNASVLDEGRCPKCGEKL